MRTAALLGLVASLAAVSASQAKVDFQTQARCIATYEMAASALESDGADSATKKRIAKLDAARERVSLALATRTDLTPADSRASQQLRKAEEARLEGMPLQAVLAAADNCDSQLGL